MLLAEKVYRQGGVIAYPTEAVFGLGCDPDNPEAIKKLLHIKERSADKGLILLAAKFEQLLPYIDASKISVKDREKIISRWPNGVTQLLPKKSGLSVLLSGVFDTIAVRVTDQEDVVNLCNAVNKPIVSTSANLSGQLPAKTWQEIPALLSGLIDCTIKGETLGYKQPSQIIDAFSGKTIRA